MHKSYRTIAIIALTVGLSAIAQAGPDSGGGLRYKWRDGQGQTHYSDSLTGDAMKYGYDLVNDQGMTIQHVERQLSPQELVAAHKLAEQQAAQKRAADEQSRNDAQMLAAYPDEASFKASQQQTLSTIDQQMGTTRINLHSQERALTELLDRAAESERGKQPVPKSLSDSIQQQRSVVAGQRAALDRQQAARDATAEQAAQQLQRYRELKAAQGQAQP
jgi:Domain of unknown function (DUF4124)